MKTQKLIHFCYGRRFFLGPLAMVLVLGFIFNLKAKWDAYSDLLEQEKNLTLQLQEKEQALKHAGPFAAQLRSLRTEKTKKPLLDQVIQAAQLSHCILTDLQTEFKNPGNAPSHLSNRLVIKATLLSDYSGFYQFLATLLRESLPLQVDSFSLRDEGERIRIDLQFSVFLWAYWLRPASGPAIKAQASCCERDPFRELLFKAAEQALSEAESLDKQKVEQVRYVGYLAQGNERSALLLLPSGRSQEVVPGSRLGRGAWQVLSVDAHFLVLGASAGNARLRLRRSGE